MKTRTVQDIRKDLADSKHQLHELYVHGDAVLSDCDITFGYDVDFNIKLVEAHIAYYEQELKDATRFGEQLSLKF